jgi:hypothetical protein
MLRRWSLGLLASVLTHIGVAAGALFLAGGRLPGPVEIEVTGIRMDELKDLPLGPAQRGSQKQAAVRARNRAPKVTRESGTLASRASEEEPQKATPASRDEGGQAPASDLGSYGPAGSRLTVLMRLDRLRGTDYVPVLDHLLMYVPDRRDLVEGTGLNLFDDFDAVLIATPNPLDPAVTFLAARHHLDDAALRAALSRGARGTNHTLVWKTEFGHSVGERQWEASRGGTFRPGDARLIIFAAPGLAVVTPPAYRPFFAGSFARGTDGGAPDEGPDGGPPSRTWTGILSRIDSEEGLMPPEGVVLLNIVNLFKAAGPSGSDQPAMQWGMEVPPAMTVVVGIADAPYLDVSGTFPAEAPARHWEAEWPSIQRKLRANPYLVLSGFSALVGRATVAREGAVIRLRLDISHDETLRLLGLAQTFLAGRYGDPAAVPPPH